MAENIQVTTELLQKKEDEWKGILKQTLGIAAQMAEGAGGLENGLEAECMKLFRQKYSALMEEMKEKLLSITAQVEKLGEIAGIYGEAERSNTIGDGEH